MWTNKFGENKVLLAKISNFSSIRQLSYLWKWDPYDLAKVFEREGWSQGRDDVSRGLDRDLGDGPAVKGQLPEAEPGGKGGCVHRKAGVDRVKDGDWDKPGNRMKTNGSVYTLGRHNDTRSYCSHLVPFWPLVTSMSSNSPKYRSCEQKNVVLELVSKGTVTSAESEVNKKGGTEMVKLSKCQTLTQRGQLPI